MSDSSQSSEEKDNNYLIRSFTDPRLNLLHSSKKPQLQSISESPTPNDLEYDPEDLGSFSETSDFREENSESSRGGKIKVREKKAKSRRKTREARASGPLTATLRSISMHAKQKSPRESLVLPPSNQTKDPTTVSSKTRRSMRVSNMSPRSPRSMSAKDAETYLRFSISMESIGTNSPRSDFPQRLSLKISPWTPRTAALMRSGSEISLPQSQGIAEDLEDVRKYGIKTYIKEDGKKAIYGGTVEKILETLFDWLVTDPKRNDIFHLAHIFILSYKRYFDPEDILGLLIDLWHEEPESRQEDKETWTKTRRTSITFFLSAWFEVQYCDFQEESQKKRLEQFMKGMSDEYRRPLIAKIQNSVKSKTKMLTILFEPTKESKHSKLEPGKFGFLDLKPKQIADQWTILDMRNLLSINKDEFIRVDPECKNWERMLSRAAMFTRWVASEIVQIVDKTKRVETMNRFVLVAWRFLENNNFNGLMCVWGGLNTVAVHRLSKTRKRLPKQAQDIWHALEEKLSEEQNFASLRKAMKKQLQNEEPLVPWFELINKLRNWTDQYDDLIPSQTMQDAPLLNFSKMAIIGEQLLTFEEYKKLLETVDLSHNDNNRVDSMIRTYLEHLPTYNDEVLWKFSLQCEPDNAEVNVN